jgi:hypothetical protein
MGIADPAEILSADGSGNEKTAKTLTVLPLFSAVLAKSNQGSRNRQLISPQADPAPAR